MVTFTSRLASAIGFPCSLVISIARSSAFAFTDSVAAEKISPICSLVIVASESMPCRNPSIARSTVSTSHSGTVSMISRVHGFRIARITPDGQSDQFDVKNASIIQR